MNEDERAPLNEKPIHYGVLALAWRRVRYGIRRKWRKLTKPRVGDPPTE